MSAPVSPKDVEMPAAVSPIELCAFAALYCAFSTSFWVRKLFTRCCSAARVCSSFSCSSAELLALRLHAVDLGLRGSLAGQRLPGQVLLALRERRLGLVLEVVHRVLELLLLQFDLLAGRGDRHQPTLDLVDLVEHLLVGQVEHLVRLLGGVERLVGLGLEYVVRPLEEAHADVLLVIEGGAAPVPPPRRPVGRCPAVMAGPDTPKATAVTPRHAAASCAGGSSTRVDESCPST